MTRLPRGALPLPPLARLFDMFAVMLGTASSDDFLAVLERQL
jgi:hypothetical protein